jgi:hypothetical protein
MGTEWRHGRDGFWAICGLHQPGIFDAAMDGFLERSFDHVATFRGCRSGSVVVPWDNVERNDRRFEGADRHARTCD